jgi:hypothetical protein
MRQIAFVVGGLSGDPGPVRWLPWRRERLTFPVPLMRVGKMRADGFYASGWRPHPAPKYWGLCDIVADALEARRHSRAALQASRRCLRHLHRLLVARAAGELALADVEFLLAWRELLNASRMPLSEYTGRKLLADEARKEDGRRAARKRYRVADSRQRDRDARIRRAHAAGTTTGELSASYGLSDRQIRNIVFKAKARK